MPGVQSRDVVHAWYGRQVLSMQSAADGQSAASTHCTQVLETGSQMVLGGSLTQSRLLVQPTTATHVFASHRSEGPHWV
jgi:hypothetical protein